MLAPVLERASFLDENDPSLRVILMVPRTTVRLHVGARVADDALHDVLRSGIPPGREGMKDLPAVMRQFFPGGTPIVALGGALST